MKTWDYVVHLRKGDSDPIMEVEGTFVGTYMQAWSHVNALALQYESRIVKHLITGKPTSGVVRTTPEVIYLPKALPAPPQEPTPPEGCEWAEVHEYTTKEYTGHGNSKANRKNTAHSQR